MESHEEENLDNNIIDNLANMFGNVVCKEVIATLVDSYEGDLNLSVDAIMKIINDGNGQSTSGNPSDKTPSQENCTDRAHLSRNTVNHPVDAVVERNKSDTMPQIDIRPITSQNPKSNTPILGNQPLSSTFAAHTSSKSTGAIPRQMKKITLPTKYFWTDQLRKIMRLHNNGFRIMIIMRGLPGSGKSHLSKLLLESLIGPINAKDHIFSTDDYFFVRGQYKYDVSQLSIAHSWNQNRVREATRQGRSPIIVDNTNIEIWEMRPYAIEAINNGYYIEVVEPNTPWAKKPRQLSEMNTHNVPVQKIKRMLDNYVENVNGESLMHSFGLNYSRNMAPPLKRLIPSIQIENTGLEPQHSTSSQNKEQDKFHIPLFKSPIQSNQNILVLQPQTTTNDLGHPKEIPFTDKMPEDQKKGQLELATVNEIDDLTEAEKVRQKIILDAEKKLEEFQKVEEDWENGEKWDDNNVNEIASNFVESNNEIVSNTVITNTISSTATVTSPKTLSTSFISNLKSKPPREKNISGEPSSEPKDNVVMKSVNDCQDWRYISLFMPPWENKEEQQSIALAQIVPIEKKDSSTCMEIHDNNLIGKHKIIAAASRNINEFYIPPAREKIPDKRMFDKSTMTNDDIIKTFHCPQKERHFIAFRKLFKHIERESLRYIFDNCCGDTNWAVDNILEGEAEYKLKTTDHGTESDSEVEPEEESDQPCTCLVEYEIVPNVSKSDALQMEPQTIKEETEQSTEESITRLEKKKRVIIISEDTMKLKKQIEQNVVIADNHYSDHCLKIRKIRRGELNKIDNISEQPSTSRTPDAISVLESSDLEALNANSSDDDSCSESNSNDGDKIVNINLGSHFIKELDTMFGRKDMEYPDNIRYNISIPTSLVNEINALWMESIMYQLDENSKKVAAMIKQDEDFARELALKEMELRTTGKDPEVPDFKEIMDLELALNLRMKDESEWRNNIRTDLAAKLTHTKLFDLFPEVKQDTLLEMLFAHNNNFKATVEVLLISLGREEILEKENGLDCFIMEKEVQRQEKLLAEENKALVVSQVSSLPEDEPVDMATIMKYRDIADKHLNKRNTYMQKAEEYIRRGMCLVANHYSEIAAYHKMQYEQANSRAVAILMQYHAQNNPDGETVDLHYFRVKEAKETMDLFIDGHIQRLKETNKRHIVLFFITGRGLHSSGRPRVKPACIKRLRERGLTYSECNPGLLRSRVSCEDKLTFQIP